MIRSENDLSEYAQLMDTILTARQLILSGGFLESCLKSQLLYMTFIRLKAGLDTEVHLPMDAIYKAEHTTREYFIQTGFTAFEVHDSFLSIVLELNRTVLKDDPFGKEEAQSLFLEKSNYSIFVDRAKITPKIDPSPINIYFWSEMTDMASFLKVLK